MTNKAQIALVAFVLSCFMVACGQSSAERVTAAEKAATAKAEQSRAEKDALAAKAAAVTSANAAAKQAAAKTHQLTDDQANRVAAEIIATAALLDDVEDATTCYEYRIKWDEDDLSVAEFGLGLPLMQWECSYEHVRLDDAKRALAAVLARHSIDVLRNGPKDLDVVTDLDVENMLCEVGQYAARGGNYGACLKRMRAKGPNAQEKALITEARQCADATVSANAASIGNMAARIKSPFTTDAEGLFLFDQLRIDELKGFMGSAGVVSMRGDVTGGLPTFCKAPQPRNPGKDADDIPRDTPVMAGLNNTFERLAANIATGVLLRRNPASGCTSWAPDTTAYADLITVIDEDGFGIEMAISGSSLSRTEPYTECHATQELAENAAQTEFHGATIDGTYADESYSSTQDAAAIIYESWREAMGDDALANAPMRLQSLWQYRDEMSTVHFPSYRSHAAKQLWQKSACAKEVVKVNRALIADYAVALRTRFTLTAKPSNDDAGPNIARYRRLMSLPMKDALALLPHPPYFPSKFRVPPFCTAPEPKKVAAKAKAVKKMMK